MDLLNSMIRAGKNTLLPNTHKKIKDGALSQNLHRVIFWSGRNNKSLQNLLKTTCSDWQISEIYQGPNAKSSIQKLSTEHSTIWILQPQLNEASNETLGHNHRLRPTSYGRARDLSGSWLRTQKPQGQVTFEFHKSSEDEIVGALVGLGLAEYIFLDVVKGVVETGRTWNFIKDQRQVHPDYLAKAGAIFTGMNLARHLTNLPAGVVNPESYSTALVKFFKNHRGVQVTVWGTERLKKEQMGLLLGVGQGSEVGARMVHLRYRPDLKSKQKMRPLAFVGKGVTFDTGGLDIKSSSGMRLMKKDMAGSAAMAGLCHLASLLQIKTPCDFYLPLAENSVSGGATRPGDVHLARNGQLVEIDNTDAEGRLVMADAFDVAVTQKDQDAPEALFDIATLTGAMRVAVGLDVAGFFTNSDKLARETEDAAHLYSEMAWRMPLVQKYKKQLITAFADFKNSSESGFGGAITAALFLEKFVRDTPWVHLDLMSWNNSADGAISEGANAQGFQILAGILLARG